MIRLTFRLRIIGILSCFAATTHCVCAIEPVNVIPAPHEYDIKAGQLRIVDGAKASCIIVLRDDVAYKERLAAESIQKEVKKLAGALVPISDHSSPGADGVIKIRLAVYNRDPAIDRGVAAHLDHRDVQLLSDAKKPDQRYVIGMDSDTICVMGSSAQGTLYGAMTLLQLFRKEGRHVEVPLVHIRDWPDFRYRAAACWTYGDSCGGEGCAWSYDWGDGLENYVDRLKRQIDWCLRYKINVIHFHGWGWNWQTLFPGVKGVNKYARDRGVKLTFGAHGVSLFGSFGWKKYKNRRSYPDGEIYECLGNDTPGAIARRDAGTCRSNEALNNLKQKAIAAFVENVEPGALYIHHEDIARYDEGARSWKQRCEECRKRWPNDAFEALDGGAGGYAHGYNKVCDAVFSVRTSESGYIPSRDCLVFIVSPAYGVCDEPADIWDKEREFWKNVSTYMKPQRNVNFCSREQFLRQDNHKRRVAEMAKTLREEGGGHGLFVISFTGADLFCGEALFSALPAMTAVNKGAETLSYACGRISQEPQILLNAEYMWNCQSTGFSDVPETFKECMERFLDYRRIRIYPPEVFGEDGFLDRACQTLYGEEAGKCVAEVYRLKPYPICYGYAAYMRWKRPIYRWTNRLEATEKAIEHVSAALAAEDLKDENKELLLRFHQSLRVGKQFAEVWGHFMELREMAEDKSKTAGDIGGELEKLTAKMDAMDEYIEQNFGSDWAVTEKTGGFLYYGSKGKAGGDPFYWNVVLDQMRAETRGWAKNEQTD